MRVLLISTYDLGRQPFGLASPAAWLRSDGHEVSTADLSRECLDHGAVARADWVAFHLPMHTATRMAVPLIETVRRLNPAARICCYGLYAPINEAMLRPLGVAHVIGGEFEQALAELVSGRKSSVRPVILDRLAFQMPDRTGLPALNRYAQLLHNGERKVVGNTEASRGCKHLCRHCPIVPVYEGKFRIVQREVVLADIRQQVAAGARHITFGDPDFLNGPGHALPLVEALHAEFPETTYDVTIKIEHLLKHADALPVLARTGCLFITSAVESLDDGILARLAKGHTGADFFRALALTRAEGLTMLPTFVAFTPWTTREGYLALLRAVRDLDLMESVAPIQLAIRLLIPAGSRLLELDDLGAGEFDAVALSYRWKHPDAEMDVLYADLQKIIRGADKRGAPRSEIFGLIWERAFGAEADFDLVAGREVPRLTEAWYCCAEPDEEQMALV
ncbi:MAG: CUAEP/CCAEP-tail radical SAM protein [Acidobacteriota bacterium]|nr:CUAEP/CCAEP-tail radical SAM protein [Acidobacteriota bacterium]